MKVDLVQPDDVRSAGGQQRSGNLFEPGLDLSRSSVVVGTEAAANVEHRGFQGGCVAGVLLGKLSGSQRRQCLELSEVLVAAPERRGSQQTGAHAALADAEEQQTQAVDEKSCHGQTAHRGKSPQGSACRPERARWACVRPPFPAAMASAAESGSTVALELLPSSAVRRADASSLLDDLGRRRYLTGHGRTQPFEDVDPEQLDLLLLHIFPFAIVCDPLVAPDDDATATGL